MKLYKATVEVTVYLQAQDDNDAAAAAETCLLHELRQNTHPFTIQEVTSSSEHITGGWSRNDLVYNAQRDTPLGKALKKLDP